MFIMVEVSWKSLLDDPVLHKNFKRSSFSCEAAKTKQIWQTECYDMTELQLTEQVSSSLEVDKAGVYMNKSGKCVHCCLNIENTKPTSVCVLCMFKFVLIDMLFLSRLSGKQFTCLVGCCCFCCCELLLLLVSLHIPWVVVVFFWQSKKFAQAHYFVGISHFIFPFI